MNKITDDFLKVLSEPPYAMPDDEGNGMFRSLNAMRFALSPQLAAELISARQTIADLTAERNAWREDADRLARYWHLPGCNTEYHRVCDCGHDMTGQRKDISHD